MKIAYRLMLLISVAIIGCTFIGAMAMFQLSEVNKNLATINENTIPRLRKLDDVIIKLLDIRTNILNHILSTDSSQVQQLSNTIKEQRIDIEKAVKDYDDLLAMENLHRDSDEFKAATNSLHSYLEKSEKAVQLSSVFRKYEAHAYLNQLKELGNKTVATLHRNLDYNVQLAKYRSHEANNTMQEAKLIVGSTVFSIVLLTAVLGLLIYRQINDGLLNARDTISAIEASLDFTRRAEVHGNDEVSQTLSAFNKLIARMQDNLKILRTSMQDVGATSIELLDASKQAAKNTQEQSSSSSHMAISVEKMTESITHIAKRAGEASQLSYEAGLKAESGKQVIEKTVNDIHSIAAAVDSAAKDILQLDIKSKEISTVINVIKEVAEQTNLLALNAAIEAARAGESGRGFAVVADEVRKLAERTAISTQEIGAIIGSIQNVSSSAATRMQEAVTRVEGGVSGAKSAEQSMSSILFSSNQNVKLVYEITETIREQGEATSSITEQVENVVKMAEANSGAATQAMTQAERLEEVSRRMHSVISAYSL